MSFLVYQEQWSSIRLNELKVIVIFTCFAVWNQSMESTSFGHVQFLQIACGDRKLKEIASIL